MRGKKLFNLGELAATPAAIAALAPDEAGDALFRHLCGDWGDVCPEDRELNDEALRRGLRLLSIYRTRAGVTFWILSEGDRSRTTVLLPEDY